MRTSYLLHGPPFGTWSFRVPGPDPCTLTVDGTSPLNIEAVQLLSVSGRPGHEGYAAIVGAPVAGGTSKMRARIHSRGTRCGIRFEDFAGRTLGSYVATRDEGPGSFFYCDAVVPQVPFFVVAVVTDVSGVAVERRLESPFSPKSLRVDARSAQSFSTDGSNKLFFTVRNFGSTAALDLEVTNDFGFVCSLDRNSLVLTNGEVATIGFAVSAREDIDMEMVSFARFRISAAVKERPASDNFTELVASVDHGILDESLPKLSIVHSGNQVTVEWNGNGVLEQSNDIYFGWHPVANSSNPLTVEVSSEAVFYRVVRMSARATARALRFDAGWGAGYSGDAPRGLLRFKHGQ